MRPAPRSPTDTIRLQISRRQAVGTSEIVDLSVATADITNQAITNGKLGPDAVTTDKIAAGAVGTSDIAAGASTEGTYRHRREPLRRGARRHGQRRFWIGMGGPAVASGVDSDTATTSYAPTPGVFQFTGADYAITGRTTKLRLRATVINNTAAPGRTATVGLYPVTAVGGAGDRASVTLGTVVSGSTVAFSSASMTANSRLQNVTADFDVPSDGMYALGVNIAGGNIDGSALLNVLADLQVRNQ